MQEHDTTGPQDFAHALAQIPEEDKALIREVARLRVEVALRGGDPFPEVD